MRSLIVASIIGISAAQWGKQPTVSCPAGFTLEGKKCQRTITEIAQVVCGYGQLQGNQCVQVQNAIGQCPAGTTPSGKQCLQIQQTPANRVCPPGFNDSGKQCLQTQNLPIVELCEIGTREGAQCVTLENAQPIHTQNCPPGYQEDGKGCMRIREFDCSPPPPTKGGPLPAPLPFGPIGYKKHNKYGGYGGFRRQLGAKKFSVYAPLPIAPAPQSKKEPVHPPVIQVLRQTCQEKEFAPHIKNRSCPPGFQDSGKGCTQRNFYPLVQRCSNGGPVTACTETLTAPHQLVCQQGVLQGNNCVTQIPVPQQQVCPAQTTAQGGQCLTFSPPQTVCPPGTTLQGDICIKQEFAEPTGQITVPCTGKACWQGQQKPHGQW